MTAGGTVVVVGRVTVGTVAAKVSIVGIILAEKESVSMV